MLFTKTKNNLSPSYADLLTKKGDRLKARENLGQAIETFKACGADGWVEKAERKLAKLS